MDKKYGYALGGGGGKIGFSASVVYNLYKEHGIFPEVISGISSGGLVGIMTATGQLEALKHLLTEEVTNDYIYKKRGYVHYGWRLLKHVVGFQDPLQGLYDNTPLKELLHSYIHGKTLLCDYYCGIVDIEADVFIHVHIPAGNVLAGKNYDWWLNAILATTAIPIIFQPVKYDGRTYVDGGIHHHTPFTPLRDILLSGQANSLIAVSMLDSGLPDRCGHIPNKKVDDDIDKAAIVVQGLLDRSAEAELYQYELINHIAKNHGDFEYGETLFRYYPGAVFRPNVKLNNSLDFNFENMKLDWEHGEKIIERVKSQKDLTL